MKMACAVPAGNTGTRFEAACRPLAQRVDRQRVLRSLVHVMRNFSLGAALASLLMLASPAWADDCVFDQDAQLKRLRQLASRHPGAKLDASNHAVTWTEGQSTISVSDGGCQHYGKSVSMTRKRTGPASPEQVRALAIALAAAHLGDGPDPEACWRKDLPCRSTGASNCKRIDAVSEYGSGWYIEYTVDADQERITITYRQDV